MTKRSRTCRRSNCSLATKCWCAPAKCSRPTVSWPKGLRAASTNRCSPANRPRSRRARGSSVHAGTQNLGAPLRVRVSAVAGNTVLAGIVALLERAQAERPRLAKAADRAAAWFLSRILIGSALVFVVWWFVDPSKAFPATLAVLVVTCPCALSLATPAVLAAATADLARRGVLVAHSDAFESLAKATHVLWDKTGTLTHGLVRVEEVRPLRDESDERCLALAAALERMSEHPIAKAFLASAASASTATDVTVTAGSGLEGRVDGRRLRIGTLDFARGLSLPAGHDETPEIAAESWVYLGDERGLLAGFRLTDPLRAETASCVQQLAGLGLASEIVSGDAAAAVARIAARSGIERFEARLTPHAKVARLRSLQDTGAVVVAVGDGINDAPLLQAANVAVAMGRGSALAQTSADLILVRDSLDQLPEIVQVARQAQRIVKQNLAWSIAYNLAALPLAALGLVPAWLAAIGMSLSSVFVVLNATRVARRRTNGSNPTLDRCPAGRSVLDGDPLPDGAARPGARGRSACGRSSGPWAAGSSTTSTVPAGPCWMTNASGRRPAPGRAMTRATIPRRAKRRSHPHHECPGRRLAEPRCRVDRRIRRQRPLPDHVRRHRGRPGDAQQHVGTWRLAPGAGPGLQPCPHRQLRAGRRAGGTARPDAAALGQRRAAVDRLSRAGRRHHGGRRGSPAVRLAPARPARGCGRGSLAQGHAGNRAALPSARGCPARSASAWRGAGCRADSRIRCCCWQRPRPASPTGRS